MRLTLKTKIMSDLARGGTLSFARGAVTLKFIRKTKKTTPKRKTVKKTTPKRKR